MKNNFNESGRNMFMDNYECWKCGKNTWDALHHIVKRGEKGSTVESSILNAAPICNYPCHIGQALHGKEMQKKFLQKTFSFLMIRNYKLTEFDKQFMEKYKNCY